MTGFGIPVWATTRCIVNNNLFNIISKGHAVMTDIPTASNIKNTYFWNVNSKISISSRGPTPVAIVPPIEHLLTLIRVNASRHAYRRRMLRRRRSPAKIRRRMEMNTIETIYRRRK